MGILKFLKGKHRDHGEREGQEVTETPVEEHQENVVQSSAPGEEATSSSRRNSTLVRRVSSNSMKKLRRIGQCLRLIGDDLERRSLHGSATDMGNQDPEVTNQILNVVNTDIDAAIQNETHTDTALQNSTSPNQESNTPRQENDEASESTTRKYSTEI